MSLNNTDLRKVGLKVTIPRLKILEIFEKHPNQHLSAEDIYKAVLEEGADVGLATVYRVLTQFEGAGLISRHNFIGGQAVYELAAEEHHDHMICVNCNKVEEFNDPIIEKSQEEIAKTMGYEIVDHALNIYGICKLCKVKKG
ncbi:MAG: ferric iron uptake transcriptional regulator [Gammaproteobacteria bacterium]